MHQTVDKLEKLSPSEAQSGPAARNDNKIIEDHLDILKNDNPEFYEIYRLISIQIKQKLCNK